MPAAIPVAAVVAGGAIKAFSADKAAGAASRAASNASTIEQQKLDATTANFNPYIQTGAQANTDLSNRLNQLTAPITMDEATLENTPGYKFNLAQGEKAVQDAASARGLGTSGAALKGAAQYATGLADSTYQNQFNNANINNTNTYNRLMGVSNSGQQAVNNLGVITTGVGKSQGGNSIDAGSAEAAGINGTGESIGNSLTAAGNIFNPAGAGAVGQLGNVGQVGGLYGNTPTSNDPRFNGGAYGWNNPG